MPFDDSVVLLGGFDDLNALKKELGDRFSYAHTDELSVNILAEEEEKFRQNNLRPTVSERLTRENPEVRLDA